MSLELGVYDISVDTVPMYFTSYFLRPFDERLTQAVSKWVDEEFPAAIRSERKCGWDSVSRVKWSRWIYLPVEKLFGPLGDVNYFSR